MKKALLCILLCIMLSAAAGCKSPEEINQAEQQQKPGTQQEIVIKQELETEQRILTVAGNGNVDAQPDVATVQLSVFVQSKTVEEAQTQNSQQMEAVLAAIKTMGIKDENIQTQEVTIYPIQDYDKNPPAITGYRATNTITVEIRDVKITGELIAAALQAGANEILNVEFHLLDETEAYQEALAAAVADAYAKAQVMADTAGVDLDGPLLVQEGASNIQNANDNLRFAAAEQPADADSGTAITPIQAGQITVSAQVTIQFKLNWPSVTPKQEQD